MSNKLLMFDDFGEELYVVLNEYEFPPVGGGMQPQQRKPEDEFANQVFNYDAYEFESAAPAPAGAEVIPETPERETDNDGNDGNDGNLSMDVVWFVPPTPVHVSELELCGEDVFDADNAVSPASVQTVTSLSEAEASDKKKKKKREKRRYMGIGQKELNMLWAPARDRSRSGAAKAKPAAAGVAKAIPPQANKKIVFVYKG